MDDEGEENSRNGDKVRRVQKTELGSIGVVDN
jgi:hypothetical protein